MLCDVMENNCRGKRGEITQGMVSEGLRWSRQKSNGCYKLSTVSISLLSLSPPVISHLGGLLWPGCFHQF